jgi:hypothetical protein
MLTLTPLFRKWHKISEKEQHKDPNIQIKKKFNMRTLRKQSSGMWHRVDMVLTDVSEERIASIFRVEGKL